MKIPFLDLLKKATGRSGQRSAKPAAQPPSARRVDKPSDQKLSKTVLPNATRSIPPADPFKTASLPPSIKTASTPAGTISLKRDLPPAVALALQPRVERAISLELSDVLEHVPSGYVKPAGTFDASRRVLLKASEIEKGMAEGKPSVSLATIYEQVPEIFLHTLPSGETAHVPLPYLKVLEQINSVQVRADQESDQAVPQVETPILQVTIEDKERFGTAMEAPQTSPLPPVKVEPATAKAISTAEPEPAVSAKIAPAQPAPGVAPLSKPTVKMPEMPEPPAPAPAAPAAPTRIPFNVPPNGMGGPASERVPASSGPPIPTGPPTESPASGAHKAPLQPTPTAAPKKPTSARIPFRVSPPCDDLRPKLTLVPGVEAGEELPKMPERSATSKTEPTKISLSLQAVMQNLPAFQLKGTAETIPADVRVEFPLSLAESQLASGRVAVDAKTFQSTLPEAYRDLFVIDSSETPVLLPLQEVLKNLPTSALKMRADQEEVEVGASFETPFSIKAKEDEQRFNVKAAPVSKTLAEPPEAVSPEPAPEEERIETAAAEKTEADADSGGALAKWMKAGVAQAEQQETHDDQAMVSNAPSASVEAPPISEQESDDEAKVLQPIDIKGRKEKNAAKEVVARANSLPGVGGCCLTFADGLGLAGNLPAEAAADGLCAMAPSLVERIEKHMLDTKLGSLTAVTLHCTKSPVTFFMQGNICLTVLHNDGNLPLETQNELANMTKELSRTYSQPEMADVDH